MLMVAGGAHPTIDPQDVLNNTPIEVCIVGEGEETTTELIRKVQAKETVTDVVGTVNRQKNNGIRPLLKDIDFFPAWDLIDFENYDIAVSKRNAWRTCFPSGAAPTTARTARTPCGNSKSLGFGSVRQKISQKKSTTSMAGASGKSTCVRTRLTLTSNGVWKSAEKSRNCTSKA